MKYVVETVNGYIVMKGKGYSMKEQVLKWEMEHGNSVIVNNET